MVVPNPKDWLSNNNRQHITAAAAVAGGGGKVTVGILSFEAAAAMSRLVSLHRSLADAEILRLRSDAMRSPGVAYLTSTDQFFLLRLACAELLADLDAAAVVVSRFAGRCSREPLSSFERTYSEVKTGSAAAAGTIRYFSSKGIERRVKQMEKCISTVGRLFVEMEVLSEMEAVERKMAAKYGRHSGPIPVQKPDRMHGELLKGDLKAQAKTVARLKDESLWSKTFDFAVGLMCRAVLAIFARICSVFGPFVPGLPPIIVSGSRMSFFPFNPKFKLYPRFTGRNHSSGPMERMPAAKEVAIRNSCPIVGREKEAEPKLPQECKRALQPAARTVGGSGLAFQYASVIVSAEEVMRIMSGAEEAEEGEEAAARDEIYRLLPARLHGAVRGKLKEEWMKRGAADGGLADGWLEAVERIFRWLGPVARDTLQWQDERTMDRRQRLDTRPRVLALQTLLFSDMEKTEAAIAEVLVGLSCICCSIAVPCRTTAQQQPLAEQQLNSSLLPNSSSKRYYKNVPSVLLRQLSIQDSMRAHSLIVLCRNRCQM
ncbi:hypothetical protein AXF42_Ash019100 [Apostasia shenzhenica]|uniref:DUF668 domain-containing protein n=1 Tax=Apostasia shenzhenica TaxID=1088818 RepID=A0A2I0AAA5_9ASPA|nr:hypothetical protein AXF42_Ash019100 [Apostasia shenzhenica]